MSRSLPIWYARSDDSVIPPRVKLRVFTRAEGRCQNCGRILVGGDKPQYDHIVALINGGTHSEDNIQVLCEPCHGVKTAGDVRIKAVTFRKRKKAIGIRRDRKITRWRKFNGSIVTASRRRG